MSPAARPTSGTAAPSATVLPFTGPLHTRRTALVARRYLTAVVLDDGTTYTCKGVFTCSMDALDQALASVPAGRRVVRITPSVIDAEGDTDFADLFADTVAPAEADEASERLCSRPSPFDATASAHADPDFPAQRAEAAQHRAAMALLRADSAHLARLHQLDQLPRAAPGRTAHQPADDRLAHIPGQQPQATPAIPPWMAPADAWPEHSHGREDDPADWLHSLRHTDVRHRFIFAWSFTLGLVSLLWWAGVFG